MNNIIYIINKYIYFIIILLIFTSCSSENFILHNVNNIYNENIKIQNIKSFQINLILPFNLENINIEKDDINYKDSYNSESFDFYQGFIHGINTYNTNYNVKIKLYTCDIHKFIENDLLKSSIIICPYYFDKIDRINSISKTNNIYFISPLNWNNFEMDNPCKIYINNSIHNYITNIIKLLNYKFTDYKILLLSDNDLYNKNYIDLFYKILLKEDKPTQLYVEFVNINDNGYKIYKLDSIIDNNNNIVFVVLSHDITFWKVLFSYLDFKKNKDLDFHIITSINFNCMPPNIFNKAEFYDIYLISDYIINNDQFLKQYISIFNIKPSLAAAYGFDVANLSLKLLFNQKHYNIIQNKNIGCINNTIFYYDHNEGYINYDMKIFKIKDFNFIEINNYYNN